jgi:uncharacterized protein (DUF885 family)
MRKRIRFLLAGLGPVVVILLAAVASNAAPCQQAADIRGVLDGLRDLPFDEFVDASYKQILLRSPQLVTGLGLSGELGIRDDQLDNVCYAFIDETYQLMAGVREIFNTYQRSALDYERQISFDSYSWVLADWAADHEFMYHFYPVNPGFTPQNELLRFLANDHPLETIENAEDYINRLGQIDDQLACLILNLNDSEARGVVAPSEMLQQAAEQIRGIVPGSARYLPFYTAFAEKTGRIPGLGSTGRQQMLARAENVLISSVIPAYQGLVRRLDQQIPHAPPMNGVWQLPDGDRFYAVRVRHHTTTDLTPAEIHQIGLEEVERIQGEIRQAFAALGYPADISFLNGFNRVAVGSGIVRAAQIVPLNEGFIRQAQQDIKEVLDLEPRTEVIVIGGASGGFYVSGSLDGSRPGAYYIGNQGDSYRYWMRTIAYHEAVPGHHYQIAIGNELDVPLFTKGGDFYTAFVEGWALYAEYLAKELGWYEGDVYSDLGRLQWELLRAARLVVYTGLHYSRWSHQQAIDFFVNQVGSTPANARQQIDQYLYYNGYFTAYKIGMLKILELREHAREELGDRFDLKEFHRVVLLHNRLPLPLLERLVEDYINARRPSPFRKPRRILRATVPGSGQE